MQTRKFGFRSLALLSAVVFGFAACDDTNTVGTVTPTTISVSPQGPLDLEVGQTIQVVASATNGTGAVSFRSSNTSVATVDATSGVVTAVAPGNATVIASVGSNAGGVAEQGVQIRVTAAGGGPIASDTAQVNIVSLTSAAGAQLNAANLAGLVFVRLDYTRGNADSIRVQLIPDGGSADAGDPYCVQNFNAVAAKIAERGLNLSASQVEFICPFNTVQVAADGSVVFPNGDYDIVAELFRGGTVVANARRNVTLNNLDTFVLDVVTGSNAIGDNDLRWDDGDVTVTAKPAIFSSAKIAKVTFTTNGKTIVDSDSSGGFSAKFLESETPAGSSLANITDPAFVVTITSVTTSGNVGPTVTTVVPARYDNQAPATAGVPLTATAFVGSNYKFADTAVDTSTVAFKASDAGVGKEKVRFFVVDDFTKYAAGTTTRATLATIMAGKEVTGGSDFADGDKKEVVALLCDGLNNCVVLGGFKFTVDFTNPVITAVTVSGTEVKTGASVTNPAGNIAVTVTDDNAGFSATPLRVSATRLGTDGKTVCLIFDAAGNVTGSNATTACTNAPYSTGLNVQVDATTGYSEYTIIAEDQGENRSGSFTLKALRDVAPPGIASINFPVNVKGGESVNYVANMSDNLDLNSYQFAVDFGTVLGGTSGVGRLPFTNFVTIDDSFGAPLTQSKAVTFTQNSFIRGIQIADAAGTPTANVASPDAAVFTAVDHAKNNFTLAQAFSGQDFASFTPVTLDLFKVTAPTWGNQIKAGTFSFQVRATRNADIINSPFSIVYFYSRTPVVGGFAYTLLGTDNTAVRSTAPGVTWFDYSITASTSTMGGLGTNYEIFAVGVDAEGDALTTDFPDVDVVAP